MRQLRLVSVAGALVPRSFEVTGRESSLWRGLLDVGPDIRRRYTPGVLYSVRVLVHDPNAQILTLKAWQLSVNCGVCASYFLPCHLVRMCCLRSTDVPLQTR